MCFSATASFIASGGITGVGLATKPQIKQKRDYPLLAIPFIFALQQAIEGAVWLSIGTSAQACTTYSFVLFTHIFWPMFVPIAFYFHERDEDRRNKIKVFIFIGIALGLYLGFSLIKSGLYFVVQENHLGYFYNAYGDWFLMILYFIVTVVPPLLSSSKLLRFFGWSLVISYIVTYMFFIEALFSVWCFFAAVLSIQIFLHFYLLKTAQARKKLSHN